MTASSAVIAIVLAGGRSSRFGSPKLAVEIDGVTLLDRAVRAVAAVAGEVLVAGTADPGPTIVSHVRTRPDEASFAGPLAALAGALRECTTGLAIVVGGDMPGLVPAVLDRMLQRLGSDSGLDAVVLAPPAGATRVQVLPLALRVEPATLAAGTALAAGDRSLVRLVERLRSVELLAAEWSDLDPTGQTLLDIDVPADIAHIQDQRIF